MTYHCSASLSVALAKDQCYHRLASTALGIITSSTTIRYCRWSYYGTLASSTNKYLLLLLHQHQRQYLSLLLVDCRIRRSWCCRCCLVLVEEYYDSGCYCLWLMDCCIIVLLYSYQPPPPPTTNHKQRINDVVVGGGMGPSRAESTPVVL